MSTPAPVLETLCDAPTPAATEQFAPSHWRPLRAIVLHRDGYECHECGAVATVVDHVWPRSKGGADKLSNLRALCAPCNLAKGDEIRLVHVTTDRLANAVTFEMDRAISALGEAARWAGMRGILAAEGPASVGRMREVVIEAETETAVHLDRLVRQVARALGVTL